MNFSFWVWFWSFGFRFSQFWGICIFPESRHFCGFCKCNFNPDFGNSCCRTPTKCQITARNRRSWQIYWCYLSWKVILCRSYVWWMGIAPYCLFSYFCAVPVQWHFSVASGQFSSNRASSYLYLSMGSAPVFRGKFSRHWAYCEQARQESDRVTQEFDS